MILLWLLGVTALLTNEAFAFLPKGHHRSFRHRDERSSYSTRTAAMNLVETNFMLETIGKALSKIESVSVNNKRRLGAVEIKPSSIHGAGLGLFATEKIKAGTIIAFYPAHVLGVDFADDSIPFKVSLNEAGLPQELIPADSSDDDNPISRHHDAYLHTLLGSRPLLTADVTKDFGVGSTFFVDVDLKRPKIAGWLGHIVNDGATVTENTEEGVLKYYKSSKATKNCINVPFGPSPILATVAIKKIKKGEELFTTYGCSYWLESLLLEEEGDAVETEMTEAILDEAKAVAQDVFNTMKSAATANANEAKALQDLFDS